ncbi:MAG TPA: response regulator [Rhodocyclaceae bacterium]
MSSAVLKQRSAGSEAEAAFLRAFESAAIGIGLVAPDGRWLQGNQALCDIAGCDRGRLLAIGLLDIAHPEDRDADARRLRRMFEGELETSTVEKRLLKGDGSTAWVSLTLSGASASQGTPDCLVAIVEDISARKEAETAASRSAERLRSLARTVERIASATERAALMSVVRDALRALTGADGVALVLRENGQCHYADEDAIGPLWKGERFPMEQCISGWAMLNASTAVIEDIYADARIPHEAYRRTFVKSLAVAPVGRSEPSAAIACYWQTRHRATDEELAILHAMADAMSVGLTNLERFAAAEQARQAAESANRAKSAFLANMSHEIRTPLHISIGLAHLLQNEVTEPSQRHRIAQLCESSEHLLSLINDVLDLSKIEAGRLELDVDDFLLDDVATRVARMIGESARKKQLIFLLELDPAVAALPLRGDSLRLAQVLINLCSNAVKFSERGSVRLTVDSVRVTETHALLRFAVADQGIGISPEVQRELFQPFIQADSATTRRHGGTGLGLAISRRLVAMMGGSIALESEVGAGSCFSFDLALPLGARKAAAPPNVPAVVTGRRVLLVEDHALSQDILFEMLSGLGCDVEVASDGLEALACAEAEAYDLILMDMQMPRLDGLDATRAIRRLPEHAATPIVALTANAYAEDRQSCLAAGMNGHIAKPVTPAQLHRVLGQWIAVRSPDAGGLAAVSSSDSPLARRLASLPGVAIPEGMRRTERHLEDYRVLLIRFVDKHGADMERLAAQVRGAQWAAAHHTVHTLKGIAGLVGARGIAGLAVRLEGLVKTQGPAEAIDAAITECAAEFGELAVAVASLSARATEEQPI